MSEQKKYSVMELADLVGVPRTTINDWLNKYASYIDFSVQGKRRIYNDNTLSVLKKISELRNSGISSFDIEKELAKSYPLHPEINPDANASAESGTTRSVSDAAPKNAEELAAADNGTPAEEPSASASLPGNASGTESALPLPRSSGAVNPAANAALLSASELLRQTEAHALIAKENSDEVRRIIAERFQEMLEKMNTLEAANQTSRKWRKIYAFLAFFTVIALLGTAFYFYDYTRKGTAENVKKNALLADMSKDAAEKRALLDDLNERTIELNRNSGELNQHIALLESRLSEQKKAFEQSVADAKNNYDKAVANAKTSYEQLKNAELNKKEAELALAREQFASQRKDYLLDLERMKAEHNKKIGTLDRELNDLKKQLKEPSKTPAKTPPPAASVTVKPEIKKAEPKQADVKPEVKKP